MADDTHDRIPGYLAAMATFGASVVVTSLAGRARGKELPDRFAMADLALDKMSAQMRRAADRRKVHRGQHAPESVARAMARAGAAAGTAVEDDAEVAEHQVGPVTMTGDGPLVVREKTHQASPITLEQALYEMELVGHDFYLFVDKESERPSVVYRRRGYDYGVISLDVD